jgi:hypothetical protein
MRLKQLYAQENVLNTLSGSLLHFKFLDVLDLSDNRLCNLTATLDVLVHLPYLTHLELHGE